MRHGCTVAAAAALLAGFGLTPANAEAACDPYTQADCAANAQPESSQPESSPPANSPPTNSQRANAQPGSAAPLKLKRFMAVGPARRSGSRSRRLRSAPRLHSAPRLPRVVRMPPPRPQQAAEADTAKTIPTVPVQAPALALTAPDRTAGFAAMTESWRGNGAFAPAPEREEANLPPEVTIAARFDEINAIDLAADAASDPAQQSSTSENMAGVALVTPASAAPPSRPDTATPADATAPSSAGTAPKPEETSWLSWLYGQVVDGVRTVVLAIRSIFS